MVASMKPPLAICSNTQKDQAFLSNASNCSIGTGLPSLHIIVID